LLSFYLNCFTYIWLCSLSGYTGYHLARILNEIGFVELFRFPKTFVDTYGFQRRLPLDWKGFLVAETIYIFLYIIHRIFAYYIVDICVFRYWLYRSALEIAWAYYLEVDFETVLTVTVKYYFTYYHVIWYQIVICIFCFHSTQEGYSALLTLYIYYKKVVMPAYDYDIFEYFHRNRVWLMYHTNAIRIVIPYEDYYRAYMAGIDPNRQNFNRRNEPIEALPIDEPFNHFLLPEDDLPDLLPVDANLLLLVNNDKVK